MHILIIPSWYPKRRNEISGSFFREQAEALACKGHTVGVIYPEERILRFSHEYNISDLGNTIEVSNLVKTVRFVGFGKIPKKAYIQCRNTWKNDGFRLFKFYLKKFGRPDIIHVHSALNGGLVAQKIKEKFKIPYVVTEHTSAFHRDLFSKADLCLVKSIFDNSSGNYVVSHNFRNDILSKMNVENTFEIIPNMVGNRFLDYKRDRDRGDSIHFISVGGLKKGKGFDELIIAFSKIFKGQPKITLSILGDGEQRSNLEEIIKSEDMESQIKLLGWVSREDIPAYFAKADCFVFNSHYETFGVVLIEALAMGLPVISSDCGGPKEIITDDSLGLLFPNGDGPGLEKALKKFIANIDHYDSNKIKKICKSKYSEDTVIDLILAKYNTVLNDQ